jgi:hypothetical protein
MVANLTIDLCRPRVNARNEPLKHIIRRPTRARRITKCLRKWFVAEASSPSPQA